jgi:hypothetical protein
MDEVHWIFWFFPSRISRLFWKFRGHLTDGTRLYKLSYRIGLGWPPGVFASKVQHFGFADMTVVEHFQDSVDQGCRDNHSFAVKQSFVGYV